MSEYLPYDEIKFHRNIVLEEVLKSSDVGDFGFFIEVDLKNPDDIKIKQKIFQILLETRKTILIIFLKI